ncbi:MAG TPA: DUF222 domain-containing protein [Nocardioidaceae bacterium]|jgi:hypothetical protein|nr:DUF222 domain-containing protein [Nocardioidaceae bacterium]
MLEVLAGVCGVDPWELSLSDRLDGLAALERASAWLEAVKALWLAAAAAVPQADEPLWDEDWAREDIAVVLTISPMAAHRRITHARALDGRLIAARDAMLAGQLAPIQAVALVEETAAVDDDTARLVAKQTLDRAPELTPGRFRTLVRKAVIAADPQGAADRRERARADRAVQQWAEPDGMSVLLARLPAEHGTAVWQALTALAEKWGRDPVDGGDSDGDDRSLDQRRADALVALVTGGAQAPDAVGAGRVAVAVRIDLATALGLADNPVDLPGYGPLPPAIGRALAQDGDWQRWITDPLSGELLDLGRERYRPSERLRAYVQARDGRCRFPGCTTPATRTDLDHCVPHGDGGPTARHNLHALCRRHHRLKTHTRWTYQRLPDGTVEWTDPRGRRWRDPPQRE